MPAAQAWTLTYADGAANRYRLVTDGREVAFVYEPVTPARSSSGLYSGGPPRRARLAYDDARLAPLWPAVDAALATGAPAGPRAKGTGALELSRGGATRAAVVHGPAQRALEAVLAAIEDDAVDPDLAGAAARTAQDHRVRWTMPADAPPGARAVVLAAIRAQLGWPTLTISQDEAVAVDHVRATATGWSADFRYTLDRDFASQYDQTDSWTGTCSVDLRRGDPPDGQ